MLKNKIIVKILKKNTWNGTGRNFNKPKLDQTMTKENKDEETCEKCGGEIKVLLLGDESYNQCIDCGWVNY